MDPKSPLISTKILLEGEISVLLHHLTQTVVCPRQVALVSCQRQLTEINAGHHLETPIILDRQSLTSAIKLVLVGSYLFFHVFQGNALIFFKLCLF